MSPTEGFGGEDRGVGDRGDRGGQQGANGAEHWKRAAEVTQNLRQRIEMMKVGFLVFSLPLLYTLVSFHPLLYPMVFYLVLKGVIMDEWMLTFIFSGETGDWEE